MNSPIILEACRKLRLIKSQLDMLEKEYAEAKDLLTELTGHDNFSGFGVKVTKILGKPFVDWSLAAPALGITDEMTKPFTKTKADSLRVTVERSIVVE